jgi:hypothetical protein
MKRTTAPRKKATKKKLGESVAADIGKDVAGKVVIGGIIVGGLYFLIVRPILQKVGIIKTKEEKEQDEQEKNLSQGTDSPFNPNYYKTAKAGTALVTKATAQAVAKQIHDAKGYLNDNEEQVYGAIRQLANKAQLSWVADNFYTLYQQDLYTYIRAFLSDSEMSIVNGLAKNLK